MVSMDFGDAFDDLVDTDFWVTAASVFVGFVAPIVLANVIEARGRDLPNEVYGVGTAVVGLAMDYEMVAAGGGVYVVDSLAQRLELKREVTQLGGS